MLVGHSTSQAQTAFTPKEYGWRYKPIRRDDTPEKHEVTQNPEDTLVRLIAEQGVRPIDDLDELAALWPADDDPDALMNFVLSKRQARLCLNYMPFQHE